jgi:choline dehydrogenase-like flavoprotein
MSDTHYDLIVIGSGPGGGAVAQQLAATGKRILMLERGDYLPRSRKNWDAKTVFVDGTYQAPETWYGAKGEKFHPGLHYFVGGNSKVYGLALFRLRERDFCELRHKDGISPAWPVVYDEFEPYYTKAEALYHVHGQRGEDPTEPWSSAPYAYPPVIHEPRIEQLSDILKGEGLHPFHLPLGIKLDQNPDGSATTYSPCIRCDAFDGFPCAVNAKADAQVISVDPTRAAHPNFTLLTGAYVTRLETGASGRSVSRVHVTHNNQFEHYSADIVVVACGALSSALLLGVGARRRLGSISRVARLRRWHAVQAQCRLPSPYPEATLAGDELARLRGRAAAARRPHVLARRGGPCRLAGPAPDHAGRTAPLLRPGDRAGADLAPRLPPGPAPGRGVQPQRAAPARPRAGHP